MHHFAYRNGRLHAEDIDLSALAQQTGTPFYCYSEATLRRHMRVFREAFAGAAALIAYSVKANSNLAVIRALADEGAGADVVSGGELQRVLRAGVAPEKIVFSGVGKTQVEMAAALDAGIYQFNVESAPELDALNTVAMAKALRAPIAIRVNPDIAAGGHEKISTGKAEDKFGVAWDSARALYAHARTLKGVEVKGVDVHIGSQIDALGPFEAAFKKVSTLIKDLRADGCAIDRLDLGGGLGIAYGDEPVAPPHPEAYAKMIKRITAPLDVDLIFEPGRMIAGNAGILVARIIYVKQGQARRFLVIDAGMNDLMRPALYGAYHDIWPVTEHRGGAKQPYDIVGPICESTDSFAKNRLLPALQPGELVAIMSAGAYGASQASQYNSRPLIPEIMVNGGQYEIIRKRPNFDDMVAGEKIPAWLA